MNLLFIVSSILGVMALFRGGSGREKSILVTAEKVVSVEVVKILLIDYRFQDFSDVAKEAFSPHIPLLFANFSTVSNSNFSFSEASCHLRLKIPAYRAILSIAEDENVMPSPGHLFKSGYRIARNSNSVRRFHSALKLILKNNIYFSSSDF